MEQGAAKILRTLDRHLTGPGKLRLMGGAALILGYGMSRSTEDADLLQDDAEMQALVDEADIGAALEKANLELAPEGLYLSHIWGPEQQILTPSWRESCRKISLVGLTHLALEVLGPLDLILSKLCRADAGDLEDIRYLIGHLGLRPDEVRGALQSAVVPTEFAAVFPANALKVERELG